MRAIVSGGLIGLLALYAGVGFAAPGGTQCGPEAIGLARVQEISTKGGARFGHNQYPGPAVLNPGEVVLTFDDGPHRTLTPQILDILDAHCTKATFFQVGRRALMNPDMAREVVRRGHTVGTHTWSHQDMAKVGPDAAKTEIELGISAVQKVIGPAAAPFFRFPYLSDPRAMQAHLRSRDTGIFSIDVDSYDYKTRSPTGVMRNVMQQLSAKGRGIILFHDIQPSTAGALKVLLNEMKAKGYRVVHFVSQRPQTTLADYDQRVDRSAGRQLASLPVSQRGMVAPAWEVRVYTGPQGAPVQPSDTNPRPVRPPAGSDWRDSVFRN